MNVSELTFYLLYYYLAKYLLTIAYIIIIEAREFSV